MLSIKAIEAQLSAKIPGEIPRLVEFECEELAAPRRHQGASGSAQLRTLHFWLIFTVENSIAGWEVIDAVRESVTGTIPEGATTAFYQTHGRWNDHFDRYQMRFTLQTSLPYRGFNV